MSKTARLLGRRHSSAKRGRMTRLEKINDISRFISTHTL